MSDTVTVRKRARSLDISPTFDGYSKVIVHIDDDTVATAGNDVGRTLEIDNPFGNQEMAERLLAKLNGFQYQPYDASGALLDPAAEIGDGLNVSDVYGGIYRANVSFSRLMSADVSAPHDEEIDHEFKFESPTERKFKREIGNVKATLLIQANEIRAEVSEKLSAEGGTQSFGWKLLSDRWAVTANGQEIFTVDANGGTFAGKVVASSGKIGGFDITATSITNHASGRGVWISSVPWTVDANGNPVDPNDDSYGDVLTVGSGFHVKSDGSILANSGTFRGSVKAGSIQYGGSNGYFNGGGITGGSIGTGQLSSYVGGGVGGGINFNNATNQSGSWYPSFFRAAQIFALSDFRALGNCMIKGRFASGWQTDSWYDRDGNYHFIRYLTS